MATDFVIQIYEKLWNLLEKDMAKNDIRLKNLQSIFISAEEKDELIIRQYRLFIMCGNPAIVEIAQQAVLDSELLQQCEDMITKKIIETDPRTLNKFNDNELKILTDYRHKLIENYRQNER